MSSDLIYALVSCGFTIVTAAVSALVGLIRSRLNERQRAVFDEIIKTVEQIYRGESSEVKRKAFEDICRAKKLNVTKGVQYLEDHIIPTSKEVNAAPKAQAKNTDITD